MWRSALLFALMLAAVATTRSASAQFPTDCGVVNVCDFGAKGDGQHDDTAAPATRARSASTISPTIGAIRDVPVIALPDIGISMQRKWPGPAPLQRVAVQGFATGVAVANTMFRIDHAGPPLVIERLALDMTDLGDQLAVQVSAQRDVTLRDIVTAGTSLLDRGAGGGGVFIEDVCRGKLRTAGPSPICRWQPA